MRKLLLGIATMFGLGLSVNLSAGALNYDKMIILDAEELAEGGVGHAYAEVGQHLKDYHIALAPITEMRDDELGKYSVNYMSRVYRISGPDIPESESWGRATFALFDIVNKQLKGTSYRFFALNGGNDLGGMILTPIQADAAKKTLLSKSDWPYLPTDSSPAFGQQL